MNETALATLRRLIPTYRQERCTYFPSDGSLQWFVRRHRTALIERGALVMHAGQWFANADLFDAYVLEESRRAAMKRAGVAE